MLPGATRENPTLDPGVHPGGNSPLIRGKNHHQHAAHPALRQRRGGFTVTVISVLAAPAAFATRVPLPGTGDNHPHSSLPVHAIAVGGMPGWQISLIAIGAGLAGAAGAFILAWKLAPRRADYPGGGRWPRHVSTAGCAAPFRCTVRSVELVLRRRPSRRTTTEAQFMEQVPGLGRARRIWGIPRPAAWSRPARRSCPATRTTSRTCRTPAGTMTAGGDVSGQPAMGR